MKIAITGGTGFVGRHLARSLAAQGHEVIIVARGRDTRDSSVRATPGVTFLPGSVGDRAAMEAAFAGCDAIAHCAGINREIGEQTYQRIHVEGTANVIEAARGAGVPKLVLLSFLRARRGCGLSYHESKWAAEELVRGSGLDYTVLKPGIIYGQGDHLLDHLSHVLHTAPLFGLVGFGETPVAPVAVEDLVQILEAALTSRELSRQTVAVVGPERLALREVVSRIAAAVRKPAWFVRLPVFLLLALAWLFELTMKVPLISVAQVHILAEGAADLAPGALQLPSGLLPKRRFSQEQIQLGLPPPKAFGLGDLRCAAFTTR